MTCFGAFSRASRTVMRIFFQLWLVHRLIWLAKVIIFSGFGFTPLKKVKSTSTSRFLWHEGPWRITDAPLSPPGWDSSPSQRYLQHLLVYLKIHWYHNIQRDRDIQCNRWYNSRQTANWQKIRRIFGRVHINVLLIRINFGNAWNVLRPHKSCSENG